jgi:GNAT superfamily N-acetyltransferase
MGFLRRFFLQRIAIPLYFVREQGWATHDACGELAAIMYLRRQERQGIRIMHIDDINVDTRYRRHGPAQHLLHLAENLARNEHRPFLQLAVTAGNTHAVTLYRRRGFQEQRHRYFTFVPSPQAAKGDDTAGVRDGSRGQRANARTDACDLLPP